VRLLRAAIAAAVFGTALAAGPLTVRPVNAACLTIYRIQWNAPGTPDDGSNANGEWVQIRNNCSTNRVLTSWTLRDAAPVRPNTYTFPAFTLRAGTSVKVHSGKGGNTSTDLYWGRLQHVWNNTGGDTAKLKNGSTVVASCAYTGASPNPFLCG